MAANVANDFISITTSEDWECIDIQDDEHDESFVLWEKISSEVFPMIKCTGVVDCSAKQAFDYILGCDLETRQLWDPQVAKYDIVEAIDENTHLLHYVYSAPFPVTSRDFCALRYLSKGPDAYVICAVSTEHPAIPPSKDYVRGEIFISGYAFEDTKEGKCKVTSLTHVDPKGWIPGFVVNMAKHKQLVKLLQISRMINTKNDHDLQLVN